LSPQYVASENHGGLHFDFFQKGLVNCDKKLRNFLRVMELKVDTTKCQNKTLHKSKKFYKIKVGQLTQKDFE
jgi:hypothetical protein